MYNLPQSLLMIWGKIRRGWLIAFRKKTVEKKLEHRRGDCNRCGACCKILFKCPAYDESGPEPRCVIYNDRPGVCSLFPIDAADLRERNIVMPERKCGYYFVDEAKPIETANIRWGPPPGSKTIGTFQIFKAFFVRPKEREEDVCPPTPSTPSSTTKAESP